ncbi:MAG: alpha-L-fucosidase [Lentisphaerota bacterium]
MNYKIKAPVDAAERFGEWRYGMFIHYGLYSIIGRGEWVMCRERIPFEEYSKLADKFKPSANCAQEWIALAKRSGMKYACLTARHHDGFCLFDTASTDYNSVKTATGRDIVREYVAACLESGLGVGIYYSVGSWEDPGFIAGPTAAKQWAEFVARDHAQLKELMSNYGKIDYLFYDGCPPPETWDAAGINAEIRKLQPDILISERCGTNEDVASSENHSGGHPGKLWESCYTLNDSWGYNRFDNNLKTSEEVIVLLTSLAHNGGNLLLNVGPMPDGAIQAEAVFVMEKAGEWLNLNGDAVYGTNPHPFDYIDQEISTAKRNYIYIVLQSDFGPERKICGIGNKVSSIKLLNSGQEISFQQQHDKIFIEGLEYKKTAELPRVLCLDIEGEPQGIPNPLWKPDRFRTC